MPISIIEAMIKGENKMVKRGHRKIKRSGKFLGSYARWKAAVMKEMLKKKGVETHIYGNSGQVILFLGAE